MSPQELLPGLAQQAQAPSGPGESQASRAASGRCADRGHRALSHASRCLEQSPAERWLKARWLEPAQQRVLTQFDFVSAALSGRAVCSADFQMSWLHPVPAVLRALWWERAAREPWVREAGLKHASPCAPGLERMHARCSANCHPLQVPRDGAGHAAHVNRGRAPDGWVFPWQR